MLRRKLLNGLGLLIALFVIAAIAAIVLLQSILKDMDHISEDAMGIIDGVSEFAMTMTAVEAELYNLQLGRTTHLDALIDQVEELNRRAEQISEFYIMKEPDGQPIDSAEPIQDLLPDFTHAVGALATALDPDIAAQHGQEALGLSIALRRTALDLSRISREHVDEEQREVTSRLRWTVLGMSLVSLILINTSVMVLMRMAGMVLKPVEHLTEASRQLGRERFSHRVHIDQADEFGELAQAYNSLAEQLQTNEQRKIETLHQVARTLNHELNNALAIIELQLQLVDRGNTGDTGVDSHLTQIRASLDRMSETVKSLKHVRRIVLTDYVSGEKMLDLERSVQDGPPVPEESTGAQSQGD